jgi:ATP-dependent Lhr-like helicase
VLRDKGMPVILLAGRSWQVTNLDWDARVAYVVPTDTKGKSRWAGGGPLLSYRLCQAIRDILASDAGSTRWSRRAHDAIETARSDSPWLRPGMTVVRPAAGGGCHWWTFAGLRVNAALVQGFRELGVEAVADNLRLLVRADLDVLQTSLVEQVRFAAADLWPRSLVEAASNGLKFSECVPPDVVGNMIRTRLSDVVSMGKTAAEPVVFCA